MLRKKNRRMTKKYQRGGAVEIDDAYENVLLIIDPQNDFSDQNSAVSRNENGSLFVPGSTQDYAKIIDFIKQNNAKLAEIHVSLDTHTTRHIGHPGFWSRVNEDGSNPVNCNKEDEGLNILEKTEKDNVYKGVISGNFYTPRKYGDDDAEYQRLLAYVKEYIQFYYSSESIHELRPWIWKEHCIEGSSGHMVAQELKDLLDNYGNKHSLNGEEDFVDKVSYHIKGQNNLAEMYSIFSAEMPVVVEGLDSYMNTSKYKDKHKEKNRVNFYPKEEGVRFYKDLDCTTSDSKNDCGYLNLETQLNKEFMNKLLGIGTSKPRRVFICGEAKTHCVKSSLIDLMDYAIKQNEQNTNQQITKEQIVLLANMTSPITASGVKDDIEKITEVKGFTVMNPQGNFIYTDEGRIPIA